MEGSGWPKTIMSLSATQRTSFFRLAAMMAEEKVKDTIFSTTITNSPSSQNKF
jgi:hypothetical protein